MHKVVKGKEFFAGLCRYAQQKNSPFDNHRQPQNNDKDAPLMPNEQIYISQIDIVLYITCNSILIPIIAVLFYDYIRNKHKNN